VLVLFVAALLFQGPSLVGQVTGRIVEARTGAPLVAVLVQVDSTRQRALSNEDGRFEIAGVPVGPQRLIISVVGFGLVRKDIVVVAGEPIDVSIPVTGGASTYVEDVTVAGSPFPEAQPGAASQAVLGSRELLALRGVIADDPFRAVQVLPGVAAADDYRAEFAVRALGPYHVGLAIDDVDSRLLFHTVRGINDSGSLALVNSDLLEDATLLSGTHPQKFGSHLGARLDFRTRDGARDRLRGRVMISGSATTTVWEGPIGNGTRGSWLIAGRKSYIDWILRRMDTSIDGTFGFIDAQGKVTLNPTPAQTLRLTVLGGRSELNEDSDGGLNSFDRGQNRTAIGNLQWRWSASPTFGATQQLYVVDSRYANRVSDGRAREEGADRDILWRGGIEWSPARAHVLDIGGQAQLLRSNRADRRFTSNSASLSVLDARGDSTSQAAWISWRWTPAPTIIVTPGLRGERWSAIDQSAAAPWVLLEWQARPATRLRGGIGQQHQSPGFDEIVLARGSDQLVHERARIVDVGVEQRLSASLRVSAVAYHRVLSDGLRLKNAEFRQAANGRFLSPGFAFVDNVLDGDAQGVEVTLDRRSVNGLAGWVSYAWGTSEMTDTASGERFAADYDQRHTLNMNLSYRWSERSSVSGRYRYGSNFPLRGYLREQGDIHVLTMQRNVDRLPEYSRLDVRVDRSFTFRRRRLTLFAEVINVLNRRNVRAQSFGINTGTGEVFGLYEKLFPLLPSAGVLIEW
jgi:hypothetical protein